METGLVLTSQTYNRSFKLLQPIGTWGADFSHTVFEAVILPERNDPNTHVAIKVIRTDTSQYELAHQDIEKFKFFVYPPPENILRPLAVFNTRHNNIPIACIVLPFDNRVSSLRSLMQSDPKFYAGIPLDCIAFALDRLLVALNDIHFIEEFHNQITAGNIFFDRRSRKIKVAFASSVYERNPPAPEETECPINTMLDWARPPEIEKDETTDFLYTFDSDKSDIWFLGITALEFAYGNIKASTRQELLQIARYIYNEQDLPNTWEELKKKTAAYIADHELPPKKRARVIRIASTAKEEEMAESGFPVYFVRFVASCLATNPEDRMSVAELREHEFLRRHRVSLDYFEDVLVKGKTALVAKFMIQTRKIDSAWNRKKPTLRESFFKKKLQQSE